MGITRKRLHYSSEYELEQWDKVIDLIHKVGLDNAEAALSEEGQEVKEGTTMKEERKDKMVLTHKGRQSITSLDQAIEFFEIDTENWDIVNWVANSWDVTSVKNGLQTNYQVKVWLKRKVANEADIKADILSSIEPIEIKANTSPAIHKTRKYAVELMVTDLHLGKVGFDPVTLSLNWSVDQCRQAYQDCINYTLSKLDLSEIDHFILPTGNDFYNINSDTNDTKAGTPQLTGQFFQQLFKIGRLMIQSCLEGLYPIAPVHAYFVPGNHDHDAVFGLGDSIDCKFEQIDDVHVYNRPILRQYHRWENEILIGYHHGHQIKQKNWMQTMMVDRPEDYAAVRQRFMRFGHYHKNQKKRILDYTIKDEEYGVEIEICPSLSPVDVWHYNNLFIGNNRRSKSFVYERGKGLVSEIYYNLR